MTDSDSEDPDAIRRQMASVRSALDEDVYGLVENAHALVQDAKKLTDWRYYVKAAPWGAVGVAAAVGFLMVPRKVRVVRPDAEELAKLAGRHPFVLGEAGKAETKKDGPTQVIMTLVANALLRAATAYVSQQAGKVFGQQAAEASPEPPRYEVPKP